MPPADQKQLARILDQFERESRQGSHPVIEEYLKHFPQLGHQLLRELLKVEISLRRYRRESLVVDEYLARFPEHGDFVYATMFRDQDATAGATAGATASLKEEQDEPEARVFGRYVVRRKLGEGGFGIVYLAHDPQLDRLVAIKVPRRSRFGSVEQIAAFIQEARTTAKLRHLMLVTVYDVQEENGCAYIVQEYIDGPNLAGWAAQRQPSLEQVAEIFASIAEAIGYVHQNGLTHCDLKLSNVLIDSAGKPHVADFGLAVHETSKAFRKGQTVGTPAMMAPEQVRGEGHRLDDRTDIWALGVMMYKLMTGRLPFNAASQAELFDQIQSFEPKPLRQIDRGISRELERICLRCLSKRRTDRYQVADDLREDLLAWLESASSILAEQPSKALDAGPASGPSERSSGSAQARVIPKGLRSFDAEDADFFLDLLPGPRDRNGLPEAVRFWKNRMDEKDADHTFPVGLLYGPSGCGKSSLVKAGLVPRLSHDVLPVYVEATAADTELRLLKQLRKHVPQLDHHATLPECCQELRLHGSGTDRKVVLIIDQFEQWLHAHRVEQGTQLARALRQADGGNLQCLLMVRDDFWMAVTRFLHELEIRLVEGHNVATVDLFSVQHATTVLAAIGGAYGTLSGDPGEMSEQEREFLAQSIAGLAEEDRVVSVRLTLFAEMMKGKRWTPASLRRVGGARGVGKAFLEATFSSNASPQHRYHATAAREILKALLPQAGTDIRGHMLPESELMESCRYKNRPQDFQDLVRILDNELRLITPTDPEGNAASADGDFGAKFYQLTHDYLVPSLRQWLREKQTLREEFAQWCRHPDRIKQAGAFSVLAGGIVCSLECLGLLLALTSSQFAKELDNPLVFKSSAVVFLCAGAFLVWSGVQTLRRNGMGIVPAICVLVPFLLWESLVLAGQVEFVMGGMLKDYWTQKNVMGLFFSLTLITFLWYVTAFVAARSQRTRIRDARA